MDGQKQLMCILGILASRDEEASRVFDWREKIRVHDPPRGEYFDTYALARFVNEGHYSEAFRMLVCRCLAEQDMVRPSLRELFDECVRRVEETPNWQKLADEVSEIFDEPPVLGEPDEEWDFRPGRGGAVAQRRRGARGRGRGRGRPRQRRGQ